VSCSAQGPVLAALARQCGVILNHHWPPIKINNEAMASLFWLLAIITRVSFEDLA
jgi:hypothetical protein